MCLGKDEAKYVSCEIHKGYCGNHLGERALAQKALLVGYFWLITKEDVIHLVKMYKSHHKYHHIS